MNGNTDVDSRRSGWRGVRALANSNLADLAGKLIWSLAGFVLTKLTLIVAGIAVAHRLGTAAFAEYSYFQFTANLLASFAVLGVSAAVIKFSSEAATSGETKGLVACFQICLLLLATLTLALAILPSRFVFTAFEPRTLALLLATVGVALQALSAAMLTGAEMQRAFFTGSLAGAAALAGGTVAAIMLRRMDVAIWAIVAMYFVQLGMQFGAGQQRLQLRPSEFLRLDRSAIAAVAGVVGAIAIASQLAAIVPWLVTRWLVTNDPTLVAAAVFAASLNIFGLVLVVPGRAVQIGFVRQLESARAGSRNAILRQDLFLSALCCGAALLCLAAFAFGRDWLISQYGPQTRTHQVAIFAFAVAGFPAALYSVLGNRLLAHDEQWAWLGVTFVWTAAVLGVISFAGLDPIWAPAIAYNGAYGVAVAAALIIYVTRLVRRGRS